ncbi:MAG: hypothetical protein OEV85_00630 [Candidatus Thorarchaeota archaeon]|nr:hypothetical protein [Candidatus Thorarchaeota archaeon]
MSDLIPVMVFMPVGVCGCSQTGFLGRIYDAVKKYRELVDYREYSAESEQAKQFRVGYRGVVVGSHSLGANPSTAAIEAAIVREIEKLGIKVA